jgi:uncharacterized repeat protein (TIGR01451 family)
MRRSTRHSRIRSRTPHRQIRPHVEVFEDRVLMSTFTVLNTNDSGPDSLRSAMLAANTVAGPNQILFNIPGAGVHTITPLSALPPISEIVTLDGYSQPGSSPNTLAVGDDAVIDIELDGETAGPGVNALAIGSGSTTVRGLAINRFGGVAFYLTGGNGDVIAGNFIATDPTGTSGFANATQGGIQSYISDLTVGGTSPADRNIVSASYTFGIDLFDGQGDRILNNYVGTDKTGTAALGNRFTGIYLRGAGGVIVGGTTIAERNVVSGGRSDGITAETAANLIQGNYIGTDASGTATLGNRGSGLVLDNGGSTVGGTAPGAGNLISGNAQAGINIHFSAPTAPGNVVEGNLIGTDKTGTLAIPNGGDGVNIGNGGGGGFNNTIGGTTPAARNIISGNVGNGISSGGTGSANVIVGNYVGVDITGLVALPNSGEGVDAYGSSNITIGGTAAGAGNVIAANKLDGVFIFSPRVVVQGNLIGLGSDGVTPLGNGAAGIITYFDTQIGGTTPAARNIISANGSHGVVVKGGTAMAVIQGNFIGTDVSGMLARGNTGYGVDIDSISNNTIGGADAGAGNVIAANGTSNTRDGNGVVPGGILISAAGGNLIQGNQIGLAADGTTALGNRGSGVFLGFGATNNTIRRNTIAFNAAAGAARGAGVSIVSGNSTGNVLDANSIFSNAGLGIDLGNDGPTPNTPGGPHTGPNDLQNDPVIASATSGNETVTFGGTLDSTPATTFRLEFFSNHAADPSGFDEGEIFLGSAMVTTDANGKATFSVETIDFGGTYSATATDPAGNTSEFSATFPQTPSASANLGLTLGSVPAQATVDQIVTYTLTASNNGPTSTATGVVVIDTIPVGATIVSATPAGFTQSGGDLTFNLGNLTTDAPDVVTVSVHLGAGTAINTARISTADQPDPEPENNRVTSTTQVEPAPVPAQAAVLTVSGQAAPVKVMVSPTNTLTYSFTITNTGNAPATAVGLSAVLPTTASFVSGDHGASVSGGVLSLTVGTLDAGATVIASVIFSPTTAGSADLDAQVTSGDASTVLSHVAATILPAIVAVPPTDPGPAPTVTGLVRTGIHWQPTTLFVSFSGPLDPTSAGDVSNYRVVGPGCDGRFGTRDDVRIGLLAASYDSASRTVTLHPARRLNFHHRFQITVAGAVPKGVMGLGGQFLDGGHNGHPGRDATIVFGPESLRLSNRAGQRPWRLTT